jgi:hypothetical protein
MGTQRRSDRHSKTHEVGHRERRHRQQQMVRQFARQAKVDGSPLLRVHAHFPKTKSADEIELIRKLGRTSRR